MNQQSQDNNEALDASSDVLKVLQEADGPMSEDEIATVLKSAHDAEAVGKALAWWRNQGEAIQDADGKWVLTH
jgi:hypothetical protein